MNDNYLWDRTGKPDTEIQELEDLLGTLRYQQRPLEIPVAIKIGRKRTFVPLAIAATIALFMIGGGLWIRFANSRVAPTTQAAGGSQSVPANNQTPPKDVRANLPPPNETVTRSQKSNQSLIARSVRRPIRTAPPALTPQELAQKEQVLIALRLVSAKLNLAQRKAQGLPQVNAIRNQHKMG